MGRYTSQSRTEEKKNTKMILKILDIDEDLLDNIPIAYSSW